MALMALDNLEHRGADGRRLQVPATARASCTQMPDAFLREEVDFELPESARYGVAMCFLPTNDGASRRRSRRCSS